MAEISGQYGLGWLPDYPDFHDFHINSDKIGDKQRKLGQNLSIKEMISKVGVDDPKKVKLPKQVDLREWCSPVEHQGKIGSCTANAGVGMVEYFERRAFGKHIDASRLFLYKTSRNLLRQSGDTGSYLRTTMQAMVLFGIPPEEFWKYDVDNFDKEPSAFCYSFAQNYQAICYYRLDSVGVESNDLLTRIKANLVAGLPAMFGFTVFSSIVEAQQNGCIPYPTKTDHSVGGHAVMAVGYDDSITITPKAPHAKPTQGAILIRNSWGTEWGQAGYGWLPYDYILNGLALDWWSLMKNEWIDTGQFRF